VLAGELLGVIGKVTKVWHECPLFRRWLDGPCLARRPASHGVDA
jgi:hypothetical protein